ncbi:hypothetical protein GL325_11340 [Aeromicrobium sp. 636]|uniref:Uncharacterized protein n=1 Tax=Aeromicrobium senzhongii TaxID=2663859 RepID=A0A8I0EWR7_9ACTN|nr:MULTISPECIES: hypothetical protein [Aeromicrobium]MBC9226924.1 hypothetical protein [Aeromicrobium senzhongii]MCQ3999024.1 hypothetical protein [Aeromicrobium sp. 636]
MGWGCGAGAAALLLAVGGCSTGDPETAVDDAYPRLEETVSAIRADADVIFAQSGDDPTAGMATAHQELYDVPSRDPLTWRFYLSDIGTTSGGNPQAHLVGGCLEIVDADGETAASAFRCPASVQREFHTYLDFDINLLTGEPWD